LINGEPSTNLFFADRELANLPMLRGLRDIANYEDDPKPKANVVDILDGNFEQSGDGVFGDKSA